ncbi:MAG: chemotaxis protein CheR [Acidobacteria bacterium]|nr:chemotaxis protein CheR [Acidobacteriota bacterium]
MARSNSDALFLRFSELLAEQTGLHFQSERWPELGRAVGFAAREFGFGEIESCLQWLVSAPLEKRQIEILASYLTVGETYFFREQKTFDVLEEQVLPELIRSRRERDRRLRVWSAGCCTGEEPYSVAILLHRMIPDLRDWNINILATDINPRFLQKATEGIYSEWSFRGTSPGLKERYFKNVRNGRFEILPHLKNLVSFSYLNLAEDAYPSLLNQTNAMDIIFCRNVLMYFHPDCARRAVGNLHRSLADGGWLIVSPSEVSHILFSDFSTVSFPGTTLYRKNGEESGSAEVFPATLTEEPMGVLEPLGPCNVESGWENEPVPSLPSAATEGPWIPEPQPDPYQEGLALYERGLYEKAAAKIEVVLSGDSKDAIAMTLLARAYANQGKLGEALEWCEKGIAADKLNPASHYLRATILQECGQAEGAVLSLKRALYLDPTFVLAHFALGNLAQRLGKRGEAKQHFENALVLLSRAQPEEILPESEGITANRLTEVIRFSISQRTPE